ncbi:LacI family DNA-binding transcriptional regulator [Paenibacillus hodogayensis]|uniref:LacI family DNA-binding transcriptional regulator n=1 Tax=Paenibacillus hodogayensis TaxID=279208 RepID=A0ABV5W226_9BACL
MTTRKEVADRAGVSIAVVSYVLNDSNYVKEETRRKVLQAIEELGYETNMAARALKMRKTEQLAVLINHMGNPHEAGLLLRIEEHAAKHNYMLFFQTFQKEKESKLKALLNGRVDGIFLLGQSLQEDTLHHFRKQNIPIVSVTTPVTRTEDVTCIDLDWTFEYARLIRLLKAKGHKRIAFMAIRDPEHPLQHRLGAFRRAMETERLQLEENDVFYADEGGLQSAYDKIKPSLSSPDRYTAIVSANDLMAAGIVAACRDRAVHIPNELAVAGSEDILMSSQTAPPMTVIHYPREKVGEIAMEVMLAKMQKRPAADRILQATLVERKSS